jgi:hypothetical protein
MFRSAIRIGLVTAMSSACLLGIGLAAHAAGHFHTEYAEWTLDGKSGTVRMPAGTGSDFPDGTFTSDSTTTRVPTGRSTFLNTDTPFGAEFGSSRDHGYLYFGTAAGRTPSTTTITFDHGTPTGRWGFALGDIDADHAKFTAKAPDGTTLTAAELGWEGAFNYCQGSPRPSSCTRPPFTDVPHWNPGTSTLIGSGSDTDGASGWFRPTKAVKELTIVFSVQSGIPIGQLWIAAKWPVVAPPDEHIETPPVPSGFPGMTEVVIKDEAKPDPAAQTCKDLPQILIGAAYADPLAGSTPFYHDRNLCWQDPAPPGGGPVPITFRVTPGSPPWVHRLVKAIGAEGRCHHRCFITIRVLPRDLCRAAVGTDVRAPGREAARAC